MPRRRRRGCWAWGCGLGIVVPLLAVLGAWLVFDRAAGSRLSQAVRDADRLDPGWTLAEIEACRRKPNDEENAARRVRLAYAAIPGNWLSALGPSPFRGFELQRLVTSAEPPLRLDGGPAEGLREEVEALAPAIAEARPLARLSWGRYELNWDQPLVNSALDHAGEARQVARLLQLDAMARAQDGDIDGALESCRALIGAARSFGDEPLAISQLVRNAVDGVALDTAQRALAQGRASDSALAKMQARLAEEAAEPVLLHALRGERAHMDDMFDKMATGRLSVAALGPRGAGGASQRSMLEGLAGPYIRHNQGIVLDYMNKAVEVAKLPLEQRPAAWGRLRAGLKPAEGMIARFMSGLSQNTMTTIDSIFESERHRLAMLEACRTLLAAERFRLARGRWPESGAEIPKEFLPDPRPDPYDGRPIKLARREDGLTCYAIGPDDKDDGGQVDRERSRRLAGRQMQDFDLGFRLWDAPKRGQPPPRPDLPDDVFSNR